MFRKALISLVATAALGAGLIATTSTAEAMHRHRHHHNNVTIGLGVPFFGGYPAYGYGYSDYYYDDYNDYSDCRYRRVAIKKWNRSHTHRVIVYRKRLVCY